MFPGFFCEHPTVQWIFCIYDSDQQTSSPQIPTLLLFSGESLPATASGKQQVLSSGETRMRRGNMADFPLQTWQENPRLEMSWVGNCSCKWWISTCCLQWNPAILGTFWTMQTVVIKTMPSLPLNLSHQIRRPNFFGDWFNTKPSLIIREKECTPTPTIIIFYGPPFPAILAWERSTVRHLFLSSWRWAFWSRRWFFRWRRPLIISTILTGEPSKVSLGRHFAPLQGGKTACVAAGFVGIYIIASESLARIWSNDGQYL